MAAKIPSKKKTETSEATEAMNENEGAGLLAGKKGLIVGVANERSIAWGIARRAAGAGASLAFTFQGEALERRVRPLAEKVSSTTVVPMDVTDDAQIDAAFDEVTKGLGGLDFLVHSVAWADRDSHPGGSHSDGGCHTYFDCKTYLDSCCLTVSGPGDQGSVGRRYEGGQVYPFRHGCAADGGDTGSAAAPGGRFPGA